MMKTRKDILEIDRESVIVIAKSKLIDGLINLLGPDERQEFKILCRRVESTIRAWYNFEFEDLNQLYSLFDPVHGRRKLQQLELSPPKVDKMEQRFLKILFQVMDKSNFQILNDAEVELSQAGQYLVNMRIAVDKSKLDKKLFTSFFKENKVDEVPSYADQYVIFRRGIGIDKTTDYFIMPKLDLLIERSWNWILGTLGLHKVKNQQVVHVHSMSRKKSQVQQTSEDGVQKEENGAESDGNELRFERIRIQNMDISFKNLFTQNTVQEPTFDRMIVVYRGASKPHHILGPLGDRSIHIRHFRNIPLADMELVLPEKKNPGLTPMDWVKLSISAVLGLVALVGSTESGKGDVMVLIAVLGGIIGYIAKIYFTFQANLVLYQNLITKALYDKQLDSGRGTLLHLCDDVIQQEVKEVIMAYFVLMSQGKATEQELDKRCEDLMASKFGEKCDFDVDDALVKLEKLEIITKDANGKYSHQPLRKANAAIGETTDELVERRSTESSTRETSRLSGLGVYLEEPAIQILYILEVPDHMAHCEPLNSLRWAVSPDCFSQMSVVPLINFACALEINDISMTSGEAKRSCFDTYFMISRCTLSVAHGKPCPLRVKQVRCRHSAASYETDPLVLYIVGFNEVKSDCSLVRPYTPSECLSSQAGLQVAYLVQGGTFGNEVAESVGQADAAMGQNYNGYHKVFPLLVVVVTCITSCSVQKGQAVNVLISDNSFIVPRKYCLFASDYHLLMQADCDLVLYEDTKAILSSNTSGRGNACSLRLLSDGNLVIFNSTGSVSSNSAPLWESKTSSTVGDYFFLVLRSNGSLAIYDFVNAALMASLSATVLTPAVSAPEFNSSHLAWAPSSPLDGFPYMPVGYYLDEGCSLKSLPATFNLTLAYDCNLQSLELLQNGSTRTVWETKTMSFGPGHQCRLSLQPDGNLQILTIGSDMLVWASNVTGDVAVSWALMVDHVKGDVIVRDLCDPTNTLWNSADHPEGTDADQAKRRGFSTTGLLIGVGAAVFLLTMAAVSVIYFFSATAGIDEAKRELQRRLGSNKRNCQTLTPATIKQATRNFETKIGHGGFGDVFYGKLASGQEIAVKVLSAKSHQTKQEFYNEVELLTMVHHKYLVALVGYCLARNHHYMLVYENMGGGDLRRRLQGNAAARDPLTWKERTSIILQIAEAIEYLHNKCSPAIIHRDIKSNNILLSKNRVAKVADFGLSKVRASDQESASHVTTLVKGTPGYLDPEYHESGLLTEKSDVYAFGIVVMEILTGQHQYCLIEKVLEAWSLKQLEDLADPYLIGDYDTEEFQKLAQLSLSCACKKSTERPSMAVIVHQLEEICHKNIASESFSIDDENAFSSKIDWQR